MSIYQPIEKAGENRRVYQLTSPVTMEPIGELVCANTEDVKAAVAKARKAQTAWAEMSVEARAKVIQRAVQVILKRQDEIIDTVIKETGKAPADALSMEIFSVVDAMTYYAKHAKKFLATEKRKVPGIVGLTKKMKIVYKPLGVVGIIVPWNGPFVLAANPAVQALLAGNAVVLKGSEVTPYSSKLLEDIYREAGMPDGVVQVLMGDGQTGADLVEAGVDKISFTGSVNTGRKVAEACARQLIPVTLELGGKDAMIVCADANLDRAVDGALAGSCMNTGHYCCGTERIYVMESIYDEFVAKVVEKTKTLKQGAEHGGNEDVGAVFWDKQMTIIESHVEDARAKGAKIHVGGSRNTELKGLYYLPTVITDVTHDMTIMRDETFGPIICIQKVRDENEALRLANDSEFGLNGNVWTSDLDKGFNLARRIDTGGVSVNDMAMTYGVPTAPFGGRKHSGVGQVNSITGIRGYCFAQPILIDKGKGKLQSGYPYTSDNVEGMKKFINFLWGKTPLGRWLA